jgi:soluble lytic murein transglycosylase-like protein
MVNSFFKEIKMGMSKRETRGVVLGSAYEALKKKWKIQFVLAQLISVMVVTSLIFFYFQSRKPSKSSIAQIQELEELKTKEAIYLVLRNKGLSLNQGLDIAEVTIRQSRKLDLPMSLILAVMKKESLFVPYAISSQNAMGLMQVHPITWGEYVEKLKLNVSPHAAFDPVTNVIVATHVLKDLYDYYRRKVKPGPEAWESTLSAYYAGRTSLSQTGITESHSKYVGDVNSFKKEFDEKIQN